MGFDDSPYIQEVGHVTARSLAGGSGCQPSEEYDTPARRLMARYFT